jgi:tetratricopeptide (TPR) repeat protein
MATLRLPGVKVDVVPDDQKPWQDLPGVTVEILQQQSVLGVVRGEPLARTMLEDARDDDVVELTFDGDVKQYLSVAQLREESGAKRGADDIVEVPAVFTRGGARTRGVWDWVLRGLRVLRIRPDAEIANLGEAAVVDRFESRVAPPPGLYRVESDGALVNKAANLDIAGKWLLFIHGTASSTNGSFGGLFGTHEWALLRTVYDNRILAFQHKTLSVSPIDNALDLVSQLPAGARLHLVTHSRGGLVGELLGVNAFDDAALRAFRQRHRDAEAAQLVKLRDMVKAKNFTIEKFVRVAAPARGTLLASGRLDVYFSVLLNIVGALPLLANDPIYAVLKASALELIRRPTQPDHLPGLEAMMPESPLVHFLNQGLSTTADLGVIAGDLQGEGFWGRLKAFATDAFYREEHDLVVNTAAMFGGVGRKKAAGVYDHGSDVNHFSYFSNEGTRARLYKWLTSAADAGFHEFDPGKPGINIPSLRGLDPNRPVLLVVPDILGSVLTLTGGSEPVWLDVAAIAKHGFGVIADRGATQIGDQLVGLTYQPLIDGFSTTHELKPFPWDWRDSIADATKKLETWLAQDAPGDRRLDVIAHGAGGLLVRNLGDAAWQRISGRALLLATSEKGTFAAVQWCSPLFRLPRLLAMADGATTPEDVAQQFRSFRAVLEMLPDQFLDPAERADAWNRAGFDGSEPASEDLDAAWQFRQSMPQPRAGLFAIAGRAPRTAIGYDAAKKELTVSPSGDGQVLTDSLNENIPRRRVEAAHGDLPSHAGAFAAYVELLRTGTTSLLSEPQKLTASAVAQPYAPEPLLFPDLRDLTAEALGSHGEGAAQDDFALAVSVTHGDLRVARYPVAVGHHRGDSIVSAEAVLDCCLNRRLSRRFQMGLYPGDVGTSEVVRDPKASPPGAIIIGLGQVGDVTGEVVRRGVAAAALRHALAVQESGERSDGGWRSAAFAAVVIGTRGGNKVTMGQSVGAILGGAIDANRVLRRQKLWNEVRIDAIELVELYEQSAIAVFYATRGAVADLSSDLEAGERIDLVPLLRPTRSGQYRMPPDDAQSGWWQRISVTTEEVRPEDPDGGKDRPFRYVVLSDRARAEAKLQCHERGSISSLIKNAVRAARFDPELSGALFELLVPNEIKDAADSAPSLVLMLDAETAQIPWEMLADISRTDRPPLSVRSGMIRQFVTTEYRYAPHYAEVRNALVVGDTAIDGPVGKDKVVLPALPGAQAEGQAVSLALNGGGYQVTTLLRQDAMTVQKQLFARPYRILHLAGHGIYNAEKPSESGMLLGAEVYLTACQLGQMRVVPDVVFINCCYLGRIDLPPADGQPHRLAASVSQALIAMGVKAVIAAGWAVDDAAGVTFASAFYEQMLQYKKPFGDAVREARDAAFRKHPATNTWAAYQCYGNPGFRLTDPADDGAPGDRSRFCSRREYIDEVRSVAGQASALGSGEDPETQKKKLIAALGELEKMPPEWRDGEVLMEIGLAWRELGDFSRAIPALDEALQHESGRMSLKGIEQLGNMLTRVAAKSKDNAMFLRARQLLETAAALAPSTERWALLGKHHKVHAQTLTGQARADELQKAADSYGQGTGGTKAYPLINQVALQWLATGAMPNQLQNDFAAIRSKVQAARDVADFWDRVGIPDWETTDQLMKGTLDVQALEALYLYAAQQSGSPGEKASVVEQLEFLADMLGGPQTSIDSLTELANRLRTQWKL